MSSSALCAMRCPPLGVLGSRPHDTVAPRLTRTSRPAVFYSLGWPERWHPASSVDYLGASHQLMHLCVLGAAISHGANVESARGIGARLAC